MNLNELRGEIDGIDEELLRLFCRRMEIVRDVVRYKLENDLPVLHPAREEEILRKARDRAGISLAGGAQVLFSTMMDVSRAYQYSQLAAMSSGSPLRRAITDACARAGQIPQDASVACAGVPGAYAHEAACALFASPALRYYPQFGDVFDAVARGECAFGVLPIENSSAGSVTAVYDLLRRCRLHICRSYKLPVRHRLLTLPGADPDAVTDVYSHEQALRQCEEFFRARPGVRVHVYSNTAAAAQYVAGLGDAHAAAIASDAAGALYGLCAAPGTPQNAACNYTRFIVVSRALLIEPEADKISLCLTLPHVTGALGRIITRFAAHSLNLTKLESRPLPETDFEFLFYFDFEGSVREEAVMNLLCSLEKETGDFLFLGNYR